ncbi:MAG: hypothetical protein O6852_03955 [Gammaproteobacteria bacterium]|jgi:hypothetical protein|nr:hypothetical protein [Gammaproteobacteria bacterium]
MHYLKFTAEKTLGWNGGLPWLELSAGSKIPSSLMLIFLVGTIVSLWIALDPIQQKRKMKYLPVTLICFIGFLLASAWDMVQ